MVAYKLREGTSARWERIQTTRRRCGELAINSWEIMRTLMYEQFLPSDHHCQHGTRNVAKYIDQFQELRAYNDLNESETQEIMRFVTG